MGSGDAFWKMTSSADHQDADILGLRVPECGGCKGQPTCACGGGSHSHRPRGILTGRETATLSVPPPDRTR